MGKPAPNWHRAKALHESGKPFSAIHEETGIPLRTLKYRAGKEKWQKNRLAPQLHQAEEKALEKEAQKHGVTRARILAKLDRVLDAKQFVIETPFGFSRIPLPQGVKQGENGVATLNGKTGMIIDDLDHQMEAVKSSIDVLGMKREPALENVAESIMAWVRRA